jgi:hypothetical protein
MINTFIAYHDNDFALGDYFEESHDDITAVIGVNELVTNVSIRGLDCTEANINATLLGLNGGRFVFIALTHGNNDEFVCNDVFISAANAHYFSNSFFYSTACSTGKNIGKVLVENGCHSFIGYEEEIEIILDYSTAFYSCENFGIKSFLQNDETVEVSYNKMVENYTAQIDKLLAGSMDDLIAATYLISNRDCLTLLGNKTFTRNYFN